MSGAGEATADAGGQLRYDVVTFLSDYGTTDEFAGVVRAVIHQLAPGVAVIDLTHEIAPFDIRAGSLALARSVQYIPPGVLLAVVDPGVGTDRRAIAVEILDGRAVLVGPDNGLLAGAVAMAGGATRAVCLDNTDFHLEAPGPTFDGRDVFAPVAAHLCRGVDLAELGTPIDPSALMPGLLPVATVENDVLSCEVLWIDRYGNCQLNVEPEMLDDAVGRGAELVTVGIGESTRIATRVRAFAEVGIGEFGLLVDSYGLLALVADRVAAAAELGLSAGDAVRLEPVDDDGRGGPTVTTGIELRPRIRHGGVDGPSGAGARGAG